MFKLIQQPCTAYIPILLAALEKLCSSDPAYRLWIRNSDRGATIRNDHGDRVCTVQVWGAVSVNVIYRINGVVIETSYAGTTGDVETAAKSVIAFFEEGHK